MSSSYLYHVTKRKSWPTSDQISAALFLQLPDLYTLQTTFLFLSYFKEQQQLPEQQSL